MHKVFSLIIVSLSIYFSDLTAQKIVIDKWAIEKTIENAALLVSKRQLNTSQNLSSIKENETNANKAFAKVLLLEETIHNSLTTINGTLKNGLMMKNCLMYVSKITEELNVLASLTAKYPQFSFIRNDLNQSILYRTTKIFAEINSLVTNKDILLDYSKRDAILKTILLDLKIIYGSIALKTNVLKKSIKLGFFKAYFPFDNWLQKDKKMVIQIINRYNGL